MRLLITCALPYANGPLHIGHIRSTYLPGDIYARFNKIIGNDVLFVCATDEHGTPIVVKAEQEKTTPKAIVDKYHEIIKKEFEDLGIIFDIFSRTSYKNHVEMTQKFFLKLYEDGYIFKKEVFQPFCPSCGRFLPDRYVEGTCPMCNAPRARGDHCEVCGRHLEPKELVDPYCIICESTPEERSTTHYFFKLSAFSEDVLNWLEDNELLPPNVKNYSIQWIREGLIDWDITRDLEWGVPVPLEDSKDKVLYVWFDAPIGYVSATDDWARENKKKWEDYWEGDSKIVHFIGKDIIYHHAIFWPAMLIGNGINLPYNIVAGEYLSLEGDKMSTSRGWVIWIREYLDKFEPDALRYYLTVNAPLTRDTDFSWEDFGRRYNDELADVLGNFVHRTLTFTARYFDSKNPKRFDLEELDIEAINLIKETLNKVSVLIENFQIRDGLLEIMNLARFGNKYFNDKKPWEDIKENKDRAKTTINICLNIVSCLSTLLHPYLPFTSQKIRDMLNLEGVKWTSKEMEEGLKINKPKLLFPKLDSDVFDREKEILEKRLKKGVVEMTEISIEDFTKIELRTGRIETAEPIKGSDKLIRLVVDIGTEKRQIVTGIRDVYEPDSLVGKHVVVLKNLKPTKIFNVESQGMILAVDSPEGPVIVLPERDVPLGSKVR